MKIWHDELKRAGISIHCICTGAGAGLQQLFWMIPGSSAYLSGCSFPYETIQTNATLGFDEVQGPRPGPRPVSRAVMAYTV